jgi:ParB family chromosome partitioning protein
MPLKQTNRSQSELLMLSIKELEPNPFQPREQIQTEDIQELANSIKEHGVIEPLVIAKTPAGYQIIAGERRWRAAKLAGIKLVPCSVIKTTPKQMLELALVENVQRQDLHAIERAKGFQRLAGEFGYSVAQIAQKIAKSGAYVSNSLRLLTLPDLIKDAVIDGEISEGHARALVSMTSEPEQIRCFRRIVSEHASVRGAEEIVRREKEQHQEHLPPYLRTSVPPSKDKIIKKIEQTLQKELRSPVKLRLTRSIVQTRLTITIKGSAKRTDGDLQTIVRLLKQSK